jgi:hypothetical protein
MTNIACENSGNSVSNDFPEVRKIVEAGATLKLRKDKIRILFEVGTWSILETEKAMLRLACMIAGF